MSGLQFCLGRKSLGWTQDELARALKVGTRTVQRIEAMAWVPALWATAMRALLNNPEARPVTAEAVDA